MGYQVRFVDGKVELPPDVAAQLGIIEGAALDVEVLNGRATLSRNRQEWLEQELSLLQPPGASAVDDLIAERRAEGILNEEEFREWLIERDKLLNGLRR